jgi:hypothetical protein
MIYKADIKCICWWKRDFDDIKLHGAMIKKVLKHNLLPEWNRESVWAVYTEWRIYIKTLCQICVEHWTLNFENCVMRVAFSWMDDIFTDCVRDTDLQIHCHWECQVCMCSRQGHEDLWIAKQLLRNFMVLCIRVKLDNSALKAGSSFSVIYNENLKECLILILINECLFMKLKVRIWNKTRNWSQKL